MSEKVYSCEYEVYGKKIPKQVFEMFAVAQAKVVGVVGSIEETAKGYKGHLEGKKEVIEAYQKVISKADQFKNEVEKVAFKEIKEIKQKTTDKFELLMSKNVYACEFEIYGNRIPKEVFEKFALAQAKLVGVYGYVEETAKGYKGHLEGKKEVIEAFQHLLFKAEQFKSDFEKVVFKEIKEIKNITKESFEVKK